MHNANANARNKKHAQISPNPSQECVDMRLCACILQVYARQKQITLGISLSLIKR